MIECIPTVRLADPLCYTPANLINIQRWIFHIGQGLYALKFKRLTKTESSGNTDFMSGFDFHKRGTREM